jgi:hypothetical protein
MIFNLDRYNKTVFVQTEKVSHVFSSIEEFERLTEFPFPFIKIISYEPERNIFVIERAKGVAEFGEDVPEIVWCKQNEELLEQKAVEEFNSLPEHLPPSIRDVRNTLLHLSDWAVLRHIDEKESGGVTTLTAKQYEELRVYRQNLRNIPTVYDSLDAVIWPEKPSFI